MSKSITVLFQGDSITDAGRNREQQDTPNAWTIGLGGGYPLLVASEMLEKYPERGYRFFNRGISGNRVVDLYARWKTDCLNIKPDVLSILIGVNDTWHEFGSANGVEPDRYKMVYDMLLEWTRKTLPETRIMLLEPFVLPFGAATEEWVPEIDERRAIVKALAEKHNCDFIALQSLFDNAAKSVSGDYYLLDGVHPTPAGHRIIAKEWMKTIDGK